LVNPLVGWSILWLVKEDKGARGYWGSYIEKLGIAVGLLCKLTSLYIPISSFGYILSNIALVPNIL
jgi:hypothetical protein